MSSQKQTNLNIRLSKNEKEMLKNSAIEMSMKVSEYVRLKLFTQELEEEQNNKNTSKSNTYVLHLLQEQLKSKDEQISELHRLLDQEQQLHQQEKNKNQLLLEAKHSKWWIFWK